MMDGEHFDGATRRAVAAGAQARGQCLQLRGIKGRLGLLQLAQCQQELPHCAQVGVVLASRSTPQLVPKCFHMGGQVFATSRSVSLYQQRRAAGQALPAIRGQQCQSRRVSDAVHQQRIRVVPAKRMEVVQGQPDARRAQHR